MIFSYDSQEELYQRCFGVLNDYCKEQKDCKNCIFYTEVRMKGKSLDYIEGFCKVARIGEQE